MAEIVVTSPDTVVVQVESGASVLVIPTGGQGPPGGTGAQGPAGDIAKALTRTAMAAIAAPTVGMGRLLVEAGRTGLFVAQLASAWTAAIAADTAQGVFVVSTVDATIVWVRQEFLDGGVPINARWFGTGSAAMVAAQALVAALARSGYGYNVGVPQVVVPFDVVSFTAAFDVTYPIHWIGSGNGGATNAATVLAWNNTSSGLRIQYVDTTGDSGTQAPVTYSGSGAIFEGFHLDGGFTNGVEAERHAVHARAKVLLRDCNLFNWAGDAIHVDATTVGAHKGNANLTKAENCWAENCRNGWACDGNDDTNAGGLIGFSANNCRRWGILENSFLGNQIFGGHFDNNARGSWNSGAANHPCSYVSQGGNRYFAIHGQEVGASTNAPSGTTADNTWWGWWQAGGADAATGIPAWSSGIAVRSGGPICVAGVNNASTIFGPHIESNGISQLDQYGSIYGGNQSVGSVVRVSIGVLSRNRLGNFRAIIGGMQTDGNFTLAGALFASGTDHYIGPQSGTGSDTTVNFDNTNSTSALVGRSSGVEKGRVTFSAGLNGMIYDANATEYHRIGGNAKYIVDATTFNLQTGVALQNNSVTLINGSGVIQAAAMPAHTGDVTSSAGSLALSISSATVVSKVAGQGLAPASVAATGLIKSSGTGGIGYATGAGSSVTQLTSKSTTTPAINKDCGQVVTHNAALAAAALVSFQVPNSEVAATDTINLNLQSGNATAGTYRYWIDKVSAGSFVIALENRSAGSLSEALTFNFAVVKAVAA